MNKSNELIKFLILNILIVGSCFSSTFIFATLIYVTFISIFNNDKTQLFCLVIYLYFFKFALTIEELNFTKLCNIIIIICLLKNFIFDLIHKKIKINKLFTITLLIFVIYTTCTPFIHAIYWRNSLNIIIISSLIFFAYTYRHEISFVKLLRYLCYSLIISGLLSMINNIFDCTIYESIEFDNRFCGFMYHPNHYVVGANLALAGLLLAKYHEKIFTPEFVILFLLILGFAIQCVSRMFVFAFILSYFIFVILYIRKNKSIKFVLHFTACILALCLIFQSDINRLLYRTINSNEIKDLEQIKDINESTLQDILNGTVKFDPGRLGIWKLYFIQIFASPLKFFFGYGISGPDIGQLNSHNLFIYFMYQNGIVGYLIVFLIIYSMIKNFKFKDWKTYIPSLIFLSYFFCISLLEINTMMSIPYIIFIPYMNFLSKNKQEPIEFILRENYITQQQFTKFY